MFYCGHTLFHYNNMEGFKLENEVRVVEDIDLKHVRIPIYRLRARRLNHVPRRVKPNKTSRLVHTQQTIFYL